MHTRNLKYLLPLTVVGISSLVGCKGDRGPAGATGPSGATGPAGNLPVFVESMPTTCSVGSGSAPTTVTATIKNTGLGTIYCVGLGEDSSADESAGLPCNSGNYLPLTPGTTGALLIYCSEGVVNVNDIIEGTITCTDPVSGLTSLLDFGSTECTT